MIHLTKQLASGDDADEPDYALSDVAPLTPEPGNEA